MMNQEDDTDIEEIILNLKIISKIKQHQKLVIVNKILTIDQRFMQPICRWYSADNRHDSIEFIIGIVNTALEYIQQSTHPVFDKDTVKQELLASVQGMNHLSATYKLDNLIVAKIDIIRDKIHKSCQES